MVAEDQLEHIILLQNTMLDGEILAMKCMNREEGFIGIVV